MPNVGISDNLPLMANTRTTAVIGKRGALVIPAKIRRRMRLEEGDLVVLCLAAYEREQARLELYTLLDEAEADVREGDRGVGVKTLRKRLLG